MTLAISGTTGITLATQFDSASTFGYRNRIINGGMVIDQRNAGASVTPTNTSYTLDRYQIICSQASKFTLQQNQGSVTPPSGFSNYLGITVGASANVTVGAADYFAVRQYVEGFNFYDFDFGKATAKTVTVSFWVRSSVTGTYYGSLLNNAANRSYPFSYSISSANTWEQKTVTIAGDTTGTWETTTSTGVQVSFSLGFGSNFYGTANAWNASAAYSVSGETRLITTNSATFYITGVQLEKGSTATSFDFRSYGTELQLCQRYYYRATVATFNIAFGLGQAYSTTAMFATIPFPVTMRTPPTALEQSGTAADYRVTNSGFGSINCSAVPTFNSASVWQSTIVGTVASGLVAGDASSFQSTATTAFLGWSAEL